MDTVQLKIVEELDIFEEPTEIVEIFVNGRNLREVVRGIELPFATGERKPELAGSYEGLPLKAVFLPSYRLLGEPDEDWDDQGGKIAALGCGCGVVCCWPLLVEIVETGNQIVWKNFQQPHRRRWNYDLLKPFVFERALI